MDKKIKIGTCKQYNICTQYLKRYTFFSTVLDFHTINYQKVEYLWPVDNFTNQVWSIKEKGKLVLSLQYSYFASPLIIFLLLATYLITISNF